MTEYGIFSDEGLLEGDFHSRVSAENRLDSEYSEDDAHIAIVCPEHREQEKDNCEECAIEEEE